MSGELTFSIIKMSVTQQMNFGRLFWGIISILNKSSICLYFYIFFEVSYFQSSNESQDLYYFHKFMPIAHSRIKSPPPQKYLVTSIHTLTRGTFLCQPNNHNNVVTILNNLPTIWSKCCIFNSCSEYSLQVRRYAY